MKQLSILVFFIIVFSFSYSQRKTEIDLIKQTIHQPPQSAKPWVFWYWINGCVSKEGVTADLEAMYRVGLGGAYLMFIKDTTSKIDFQPQIRQLTPEWFAMVRFAMQEAKRLNLEIGLHISDGFALAGGPWITPEQSMQKLVWTKAFVNKNNSSTIILPKPQTNENFYKDIKAFAYPANYNNELQNEKPIVTNNKNENLNYLIDKDNKNTFRSDTTCFIKFVYSEAFTFRQIKIKQPNNAYQAQRFIIAISQDDINYTNIDTLIPPRSGWQDNAEPYTHSLKNFTTKYIKLIWQKVGSEPGSEELDAAKWRAVLRVQGIYFSNEPIINNIEAKNGSVWRIANASSNEEVPLLNVVQQNDIIDVTKFLLPNGELYWTPKNNNDYIIVRIGHTSTGMKNETGGGGKGLECDKLNANAITTQYTNWFKKIYEKTNAKGVVKIVHIDSWECGSQNWTSNFFQLFKKYNGYEFDKFLLATTGTPIHSIEKTEQILLDFRKTIAYAMNENFFGTIKNLAKKEGLQISAESVAPTFVSDGIMHYKNVDMPMGEFWVNSPTHDKPNDMSDAINAAHIYGKNIVAAESFTTLRMDWNEHPGSLKTIGDKAFANGINKMIIHVMVHNPWLDKKPGMTLDGIGLYYQRDQIWFEQSKPWIDYLTRTSALLQLGKPVSNIAVYVGDELPNRSILANKLIYDFPELFTKEYLEKEKNRLQNTNQPTAAKPDGVTYSANTLTADDLPNDLNGTKYDCLNYDVFKQLKVVNGKIVNPFGSEYKALLIPNNLTLNPNKKIRVEVLKKINDLKIKGANIIFNNNELAKIKTSYQLKVEDKNIVWTHRKINNSDLYFISNQNNYNVSQKINFPFIGKGFALFNTVTGERDYSLFKTTKLKNTTEITLNLFPSQSVFLVFYPQIESNIAISNTLNEETIYLKNWKLNSALLKEPIYFNTENLESWTTIDSLKYISTKITYTSAFEIKQFSKWNSNTINFDQIYNLATIKINKNYVGTVWTPPYKLYIGKYLKQGTNTVEIEVVNTWHNALIGNELNKNGKQKTVTNSPYRLKDKPLLPAGIIGNVKIIY